MSSENGSEDIKLEGIKIIEKMDSYYNNVRMLVNAFRPWGFLHIYEEVDIEGKKDIETDIKAITAASINLRELILAIRKKYNDTEFAPFLKASIRVQEVRGGRRKSRQKSNRSRRHRK